MNTLVNKYDTIELFIHDKNLQIKNVDSNQSEEYILINLNKKISFKLNLSDYPRLNSAKKSELDHYEIIANGTGIHWPELDEDLSLKGFFQDYLSHLLAKEQMLELN